MTDCHTLLISDLHLGSRVSRADKILNLLQNARFETLIINGDLFDKEHTRKMTPKDWKIMDSLAEIAKRSKVLLVGGNHGRKLDNLAKKAGIEIKDEHSFNLGDQRFLCIHGDEFDMFIRKIPRTSKFFTALYEYLQIIGGEEQRFSMFLKRISKNILRVPVRQQRLALAHAVKKEASVVICSHTHLPHEDKSNGIHFINSGSFCEYPCNYVAIDRSGNAELLEI